MGNVSEEDKMVAKKIRKVLGGNVDIFRHYNTTKDKAVAISHGVNSLGENVNAYSTVGLSGFPMMKDDEEFPVRLELIGVCRADYQDFPNILASAAFYILETSWFCFPGAVLQDVTRGYEIENLRHFYFSPPFLWEEELGSVKFNERHVAWLLVIPISDEELNFRNEYGNDALENLFEEKKLDISNINRSSLV